MRHATLPRACGMAAALALGLAATASAADQTIKVPCSGPTATSGATGLRNAVNAANANAPSKTTIKLDSGCAYVFNAPGSTDGADGANGLPIVSSTIIVTGDSGGREPALLERSAKSAQAFRLFDVATNGNLTLKVIEVAGGRTANGADGTSSDP